MRLSSTILVIALLCLSGISFANTSDSSELICQFDKSTMINEKLKKAQECINNGNYTAAKNYLNGVLKLDSNNEKAKELLAVCNNSLTVSSESLFFSAAGGSRTITVNSSSSWRIGTKTAH